MDSRIEALDNQMVQQLVESYSAQWTKRNGLESLHIYSGLINEGASFYSEWLWKPDNLVSEALAGFYKRVLQELLSSADAESVAWLNQALDGPRSPDRAHSTIAALAIVGATAIGLVLAARVKRIGKIEFYEGVPEEVAKIIERVASFGNAEVDP